MRRGRSPGAPQSRGRAPSGSDPGVRRWQRLAPYKPPRTAGENGSTRSCPQLYCSFVQYASEMLSRRCGGNTGTHHHAAAATLRCRAAGWEKVRLKFLYTAPVQGRVTPAGDHQREKLWKEMREIYGPYSTYYHTSRTRGSASAVRVVCGD